MIPSQLPFTGNGKHSSLMLFLSKSRMTGAREGPQPQWLTDRESRARLCQDGTQSTYPCFMNTPSLTWLPLWLPTFVKLKLGELVPFLSPLWTGVEDRTHTLWTPVLEGNGYGWVILASPNPGEEAGEIEVLGKLLVNYWWFGTWSEIRVRSQIWGTVRMGAWWGLEKGQQNLELWSQGRCRLVISTFGGIIKVGAW